MGDYKKYLEEDYDGDEQERKRQKDEDNQDAKEAEQKIKDKQQRILEESDNQNIMKEYLVHGAQLRCTKGMLNKYKVDDQITITLNKSSAEVENKRLYTNLDVKENPMSVNDNLWYATIKDTIKGQNIIPFRCNCVEKPNRLAEIERIKDNIDDCKENGVCKYLMNLNEEWDNMELSDGDQYLIKKDIKENTDTTDAGQNIGGVNTKIEDAEGITMTSILFCKHGGLIYPVTSGQGFDYAYLTMEAALNYMDLYLEGKISEYQISLIILFVSQNCGMTIEIIQRGAFVGADVAKNFDNNIVAWSYYWNQKINNGMFGNNKILIRPEIIKAMIMDESSWGDDGAKNCSRDVMQCLYPGDYALWILSGYDPTVLGRSHMGISEPVVWVKDGDEYKQATIRPEFNSGIVTGFGTGLRILDNVITIISENDDQTLKNSKDEYLVHYDEVTPNMSIACGTGYLAYLINEDGSNGSEKEGVRAYNGEGKQGKSGVEDAYVKSINEKLGCLGSEEGEVEPLK